MARSEKYRSRFYEHFVEHVGEEAAEAMLAQFPARDSDAPATKDHVRATAADLRSEIAGVRTEIADVRTEVAGLRSELTAQIASQTDRLMNRMQIAVGMGFGFVAIVTVLTR